MTSTKKRLFWFACLLSATAIFAAVLVGYYLRVPSLGGWFSNDDFVFLEDFRTGPSLGSDTLFSSFFRPISRNLFWWAGGQICRSSYTCFFSVNLSLLIAGSIGYSIYFLRSLLPGNKNKLFLASTSIAFASFLLLSPSSISLASWISNSQATLPFFLFAVAIFWQTKTISSKDQLVSSCLINAIILSLLAFSNFSYFLAASTYSFFWSAYFVPGRQKAIALCSSTAGLAIAVIIGFYIHVIKRIPAVSAYKTDWKLSVLAENINFYTNIDKQAILAYCVSLFVFVIAVIIALSRRTTDARTEPLSTRGNRVPMRLHSTKLLGIYLVTAFSSTIAYLPQTLQRYDYYMHLFSVLSYSCLFIAITFLTLCFDRRRLDTLQSNIQAPMTIFLLTPIVVGAAALKLLNAGSYPQFTYYIREPVGAVSLKLMKNIYSSAKENNVCLVPEASIRRPRNHPYYPDDFWWRAGFGKASQVFAAQTSTPAKTLSHASFATDCNATTAIYEVDSNYNLTKGSEAP